MSFKIDKTVLHPELRGTSLQSFIRSKLVVRRLLLSLLPTGFLLLFLRHYSELIRMRHYSELVHTGCVTHGFTMLLGCGLVVFSYNGVLAILFPGELATRSRVVVVLQMLLALATVYAVAMDSVYHSSLPAVKMGTIHYTVHSSATFCCLAIQMVNIRLLWTAQLGWSSLRWTQCLDGIIVLFAQLTACDSFNIGVLGALARSVPPLIAAAIVTPANRHRLAACAERAGLYHVCVDLTELPAAELSLSLSQHAAGEPVPEENQSGSSHVYTESTDLSLCLSHHTAKLDAGKPLPKASASESAQHEPAATRAGVRRRPSASAATRG